MDGTTRSNASPAEPPCAAGSVSGNPETYFAHTPGLKVICPASAYDAKGLIKSAIRDNNPVLFFEHKFLYRRIKEELPAEDYTVPIGKARVVREGRDVSVITYAAMVYIGPSQAPQWASWILCLCRYRRIE